LPVIDLFAMSLPVSNLAAMAPLASEDDSATSATTIAGVGRPASMRAMTRILSGLHRRFSRWFEDA
jgi:hypothetical protein